MLGSKRSENCERIVGIGNRKIGNNCPCFIIAEMGQSHDGSLGAAYAFVDAAVKTGVDAVKFQTHIADKESSKHENFRNGTFFPQDKTRYDYWKRTEFTKEQWISLKKYVDSKKLVFLSTPFCEAAVDMLLSLGIRAFKISSGEAHNLPMLEKIIDVGLPIILSTGMSYRDEIRKMAILCKTKCVPLVVCQCTTKYPCPPEHLGLNIISELKKEFKVPVGFSDHSGTIYSGFAAYMLGACLVEVHVTFSKNCFGPDVSSSLTFEELQRLVDGIRFMEKIKESPLQKDEETKGLEALRKVFAKGIVAAKDIAKDSAITRTNMTFRKPQIGIPSAEYKLAIGKKAGRFIKKSEFIRWEDLKENGEDEKKNM